MAAPVKGRASADAQIMIGAQAYTLRFSVKALAALQDHWELASISAVSDKLSRLDDDGLTIEDYQALLWAGLRTHHPGVDKELCLDLLDELGLAGLEAALAGMMGGANGEGAGTEGGGTATPRPRKPGRSRAS